MIKRQTKTVVEQHYQDLFLVKEIYEAGCMPKELYLEFLAKKEEEIKELQQTVQEVRFKI